MARFIIARRERRRAGFVTFNHMVDFQFDPLDRVFGALSDPTRRAILGRLRQGEASVSELAAPFPISLAAVSKHLDVLERAGLLRREPHGRERRCHLQPGALQAAADWADSYRDLRNERLDALQDVSRKPARGDSGDPRARDAERERRLPQASS